MNERMTKRWTGKHGKPMADCTALYCRKCFAGNGG